MLVIILILTYFFLFENIIDIHIQIIFDFVKYNIIYQKLIHLCFIYYFPIIIKFKNDKLETRHGFDL